MKKLLFFLAFIAACSAAARAGKPVLEEKLKNVIVSAVSPSLHGKLTLGSLHLHFGFPLQCTVEQVKISYTDEKGKDTTLLSVQKGSVSLSLKTLAQTKNPLQSIEEIRIVNPAFFLHRGKDGQWNINRVIAQKEKKEEKAVIPTFVLKSFLSGGTFQFVDEFRQKNHPFTISLNDISTTLDASLFPSAFAALTAKINNESSLTINSSLDFENQQFSAHVSLHDQDLTLLSSLLSGATPVSLLSGNSDADVDIVSPFTFKNPQIFGNASFRNIALKTPYVRSPIKSLGGDVSFSQNGVLFHKIHANLNDAPVAVNGRIFNFKDPQLELVAATQHLSMQEFQSYLPKTMRTLRGHLDAAVQISGSAKKPKIVGDIRQAALQMKGSTLSKLAGTFSYDTADKVLLAETTAKINQGSANISLIAHLQKKPSLALFTNAQNVSLQSFRSLLPSSMTGAQGNITGQGVALSASPLQASAVVEMFHPAMKDIALDKIVGGIMFSGKDIMVTPAIFAKGTSVVSVDGKIMNKTLDLSFHSGKANLKEILSRKNMPVSGNVLVEGNVGGTFSNPSMKAQFSVPDLESLKSQDSSPSLIGAITGTAELLDKELHFPSVHLERGNSSVSFTGKLTLSTPTPEIYGKADFTLDKMENILDEFLPSNPLESGGVTGHVDVAGPISAPVAKGTLTTTPLKISGESLPETQVQLSFKKNLLHVAAQSTPFNSQTQITGDIDLLKENFSVEAHTKQMDLSQIAHLAPVYKTFSAIADATFMAGGSFAAPKFSGSVQIPDLVIEEETLGNFLTDFAWEGNTAELKTLWGNQPSAYKLNASLSLPDKNQANGHVELNGDIEKGKLFSLLNLFPRTMQNFMLSEIRKNVTCNDISSHFSISTLLYFDSDAHQWVFEKASGQLKTALTGLRAKDESLGNFNADVAFKDNKLTINEFQLKDKDFTIEVVKKNKEFEKELDVPSTLALKGDLDLRARVQNLNLQKFAFLMPEAKNLKGTLNTTVILSGTAEKPGLYGTGSVKDFSYLDYAIDSFEGSFKYFNDVFDFSKHTNPATKVEKPGFIIRKGTQSIAISGEIPYIWSKKEIPRDTPFYLTMDAPDFDLAMLKDVSKTLEGIKGHLKSTMTIAGTLNKPSLSGSMNIDDAEFENSQLQTPLKIQTLKISFEKDTVVLNELKGTTTEGNFSSKGSVALNLSENVPESLKEKTTNLNNFLAYKFSPKSFDMSFQSKNLLVKMPNFAGKIDASLAFRGTSDAPELNADVTVHHASYALVASEESAPAEPSAFFKKLGLFTKIKFGDETTVSNAMMQIETKGEFGIQKSAGDENVKIRGEISSNKGIMTLYTTTFKIKEALVLFEDPLQNLSTLKPTLYAKAETVVEPRQGCRVAVTYVIDMRLDKKSLSDKDAQNPLKDPEYNEAACTDKPPGGPIDKQEIFFALGPNFKNPNAGLDIISTLGTNVLTKSVLGPIEQQFAKTFKLSDFHVDRDTANNLKVSLAKTFPFPMGNETMKKYFSEGLKIYFNKTFSQDQNQSFGATLYFKPKKTFTMPFTFELEQKANSKNTKVNIGVQYKFK